VRQGLSTAAHVDLLLLNTDLIRLMMNADLEMKQVDVYLDPDP
jgi:hypothetical protein